VRLKESAILGCFVVEPKVHLDLRGSFVKMFNEKLFKERGLETHFKETYYSTSKKNVLRGLHFQVPPESGAKLVYCLDGQVEDVALDLRVGSPTYGRWERVVLDAENPQAVYLPEGVAHGFLALSDSATLVYQVAAVYSPDHDHGILWSSAEISWSCERPQISERDSRFPSLESYKSPFTWKPGV
jgi:dTDP-4-dehydrorhamnose 3,5-epimerase